MKQFLAERPRAIKRTFTSFEGFKQAWYGQTVMDSLWRVPIHLGAQGAIALADLIDNWSGLDVLPSHYLSLTVILTTIALIDQFGELVQKENKS